MEMIVAGILLIVLGMAHSYLGERYILIRLFRRDLPKLMGSDRYTKQILRFAWHITTISWWGYAALLFSRLSSEQISSRIISITFCVSGVVSLIGGRGRHLSWVIFLLAAVLLWWASYT